MADTAPVYASAFFSNPGAVYGLVSVPHGLLARAPSGGGLTTLAPVPGGVVGFNASGELTCTADPVISGTLDAAALTADTISCTGDVTVTTGNVTVGAGNVSVAAGTLSVTNGINAGALAVTGETSLGSLVVSGTATLSATLPVNPRHAATKAYVDSVASGLHVRAAVRARTTGALLAYGVTGGNTVLTANDVGPLSSSIFDGVAVASGMRVLIADEPAGTPDLRPNNGIYVVTNAGGDAGRWMLTRAADANTSETLPGGAFVFVTEGATYGDRGFVLTADNVSLGTTALVFTQFTSTSTPPGGNAGQVQFNNSGGFGGSASLIFNAGTLTVGETGVQAGGILVKAGADGVGGSITVAGTLDATTVLVGGGGFISTGLSVSDGGATFEGSATFNGTAVTFNGTAVTFSTGTAVMCSGPVSVPEPSALGHAATKQYVDDTVGVSADAVVAAAAAAATSEGNALAAAAAADASAAAAAAAAPGGSDGQFQYKSGSAFAGSAALTYGSGGVAVRGAAFSVYGTGEVPSQILSVGETGVVISGGAEHTLSAGTGSIDDSPGIVINSGSIAIYGDGTGSGKSNLTADADGVSITRAYEISSGSGKPIRLKGDPDESQLTDVLGLGTWDSLAGATGYVAVGAISGQASVHQAGAAVAFGAGAGVTAPRGIALGMGAVARVADAAVIPALSLSQRVRGVGPSMNLGRGLAVFAAGMTFLPSAPLDLKTAYADNSTTPASYSSFTVPTGAMFIPLGAVVWLHSINAPGNFSVSPTLEVRISNESGRVILPATALAITEASPVGLAVGATPSDFTAVSGGGVIFYRVVAAASGGGAIISAEARVALYGLCVELET